MNLSYDQAIPLVDIYWGEVKVYAPRKIYKQGL